MTQDEITQEIQSLNLQIKAKNYAYGLLKTELDSLGREILALCNQKWNLERQIIKIKVLPATRPRPEREPCATTELAVDTMMNVFDNASPEQQKLLYEALVSLSGKRLEDLEPSEEEQEEE